MSSTAQQIINRSLRLLGVIAAGESPSGEDSADALTALNQLLESLSLQEMTMYRFVQDTLNMVPGQARYIVGPTGTDLVTERPFKVVDAFVRLNNIDYPLQMVDQFVYDSYAKKDIQTNLPDRLFYDPVVGDGHIYLYPTPNQDNQLYFRSVKVLEAFTSLSEAVDLPQGYDRMLAYNLARELSTEYGKAINPDVERLANESLQMVKRMNHRSINGSTWEISKPGGRYNIYTDGWR